jgi:hypothetical protein
MAEGPAAQDQCEYREGAETMSIYKRGRVYWYHFTFNGEPVVGVHQTGQSSSGPADGSRPQDCPCQG